MTITPWKKVGAFTTLAQGFGKRFDMQRYEDHAGRERDFYFFEQPDWSNVLALTDDRRVILVRQFKQGSGTITEELPGGIADFAAEDPRAVLERELLQETGYAAGRIVPLGRMWMNSRSSHTAGHMFLALDCRRQKAPEPDDDEQLEVFTVPFRQFVSTVLRGQYEHQVEAPLVLLRALRHLPLGLRCAVMLEWLRLFFVLSGRKGGPC